MGCGYTAICNKCGTEFVANEGGGMRFHLLHCNKCGEEKSVRFDELGELTHKCYPGGFDGEKMRATSRKAKAIQERYADKKKLVGDRPRAGHSGRATGDKSRWGETPVFMPKIVIHRTP